MSRGPIPKRSDQRRRRNASNKVETAPGAAEVPIPAPDEDWHPIAIQWYESLAESGESVFYEPSDWATAYIIAESISRDLLPQFVGSNPITGNDIVRSIPMKGANLAAYLKAMNNLMVTEGDRRRYRLELERGDPDTSEEDAKVAQMAEYKRAVGLE